MSAIKQYLDRTGVEALWGKVKALIENKINDFYEKTIVQSNGDHEHDINVTAYTIPNVMASYNNGVLTISGETTPVVVNGSTEIAGGHMHTLYHDDLGEGNNPEDWFIDPEQMDKLFE